MSTLPKSHAFELKSMQTAPTSAMFMDSSVTTPGISTWLLQQLVNEITSVDTARFTILTIAMIAIIIVRTVMWRYAVNRHSYIYLEVYSPLDCIQVSICKLSNPTRNFAVTHNKITLTICQLGCMAIIFIQGKFEITNTLTKQLIETPTTMVLTPIKATRIAAILSHPENQLSFLACHSHEIVPLRQRTR
jgi:hypothetical protein